MMRRRRLNPICLDAEAEALADAFYADSGLDAEDSAWDEDKLEYRRNEEKSWMASVFRKRLKRDVSRQAILHMEIGLLPEDGEKVAEADDRFKLCRVVETDGKKRGVEKIFRGLMCTLPLQVV